MANNYIKTIQSQVYEIIKENIGSGVYQPNQRLQEIEVANELNVSRSPVREAFRELTAEGLLVAYPNKGVYVKEFSQKDFTEIFELRSLLENYSIRKMTMESFGRFQNELDIVCKKMQYAVGIHDIQIYMEADAEFHQMLVDNCGNALLADTYRRTRTLVNHSIINALRAPERFLGSDMEHAEIIALLKKGEFEKAAEVNEIHLQKTCSALIAEVFYKDASQSPKI